MVLDASESPQEDLSNNIQNMPKQLVLIKISSDQYWTLIG